MRDTPEVDWLPLIDIFRNRKIEIAVSLNSIVNLQLSVQNLDP